MAAWDGRPFTPVEQLDLQIGFLKEKGHAMDPAWLAERVRELEHRRATLLAADP